MIYEDDYNEYLEDTYDILNERQVQSGKEAQEITLDSADEKSLTERERLLFVLPVIKYEIEHNFLTEEITGELNYYYRNVITKNNFDTLLGDDEIEQVKSDLFWCYNKVFSNKN